jgi:hypothetical protein
MILYAVSYKGPLSNNDWSIIRIYKDEEKANAYKEHVIGKFIEQESFPEIAVQKFSTDVNKDYVYDYEDYD